MEDVLTAGHWAGLGIIAYPHLLQCEQKQDAHVLLHFFQAFADSYPTCILPKL